MTGDVRPAEARPPALPACEVFLVATEESGDRLGAALMRALAGRRDATFHFRGVGGHAMEKAGLQSLFPIDDLAIVGLAAIPKRLPTILRRIRQTVQAVLAARPDVLVIIDSPDFTHRVARGVRKRNPAIPIVDYVSPSVWAWRPGRARAMRRYVDHVLALLPFEPASHKQLGGPPCSYVGHPLIEEIAELRPDAAEGARRMAAPPLLLVLPGSRGSEIKRLLAIFEQAVSLVRARYGAVDVVIPTVPHLAERIRKATATWAQTPRIVVEVADKRAAFRSARAALAKSGTVTLELALAGVPMVTAYRMSAPEAALARRLIKVPSVILANLVLGENAVPEFLQEHCTPDNLAAALLPLLSDTPARRAQIDAFARLDAIMQIGQAKPAERAAEIVLAVADGKKGATMAAPDPT
jgi:lipid-A-disaccharide synthase